jgi:transcription elongation factor Elf1
MSAISLPPQKLKLAMQRIAGWRQAPAEPVLCPVCDTAGLQIIDRSTRPYAEWYALSCSACGLQHTIHIPLAPQVPGGH